MPMSTKKKVTTGLVSAAVTGLLVVGGASLADAATSTPSPSASSSTTEGAGGGRGGGGTHTAVTGDEATKVRAAVTAKDSAVTVTSVQKDEDGSYDVDGTKAGADVRFDVSADLATVTERTGGGGHGGGGGGGGGGSADTPVSGDEATKASAAVTAKDSAVTVTSVRKDPDGSYDVLGTKAGADVFFDVSADLATVTEAAGRAGGGGGGRGGHGGGPGGSTDGTTDGSSAGSTQESSTSA